MKNECDLEKTANALNPNHYFDKPVQKNYIPVSREGWPDIGINGGGDLDWVDYTIA